MNIMHKLTLKSLRMNRSRTIATLIGIILSMALITIVANVIVSLKESEKNYFEKYYGNYDIALTGRLSAENVEKLEDNRDVSGVYLYQNIGIAPFENSKSNFRDMINITAFSENTFGEVFDSSLSQGRYPENPDEVVLSEDFVNYSDKIYNVGDKITLSIGMHTYTNSDEESSEYEEYAPDDDKSEFEPVFTKTYTVCGILNREPFVYKNSESVVYNGGTVNIYTYTDFTDKIQTAYDNESNTCDVFIKLRDTGRENAKKFLSDLLNINIQELEKPNSDLVTDEDLDGKLSQSEFHISYAQINGDLYDNISKILNIIFYVGLVLIIIIMISSVFIIKNGFLISLTEKTVLYGKISGIGATPRQIRNSIFFEGLILGIIGLPVGLTIGIGGTTLALGLSSKILSGILGGAELIFSISWLSLIPAVILGALTIFFSSLFAAVRAYRISPIEAIRSNKYIRIKRKKKNPFKSPAWVGALFGAGGKIAWKNMKRSSRQYRTVVISLVVSISVFIGVFSFVDYTIYNLKKIYAGDFNYNMTAYIKQGRTSEDDLSFDEKESIFLDIARSEEIKEFCYKFESCFDYCFDIPIDKIPDNILNSDYYDMFMKDKIWDNTLHNTEARIVAYDDNTYNTILDRLGYSYDDMKDKAILVNIDEVYDLNHNSDDEYITDKFMVDPIGYKIDLKFNEAEQDERSISQDAEKLTLEIGGEVTDTSVFDDTVFSERSNGGGEFYYRSLIVSKEWMKKNYYDKDNLDNFMYILSEDPDKTEQSIDISGDYLSVENHYTRQKQINSVIILVQFLLYGFLCAISLIGITNIFNTINTNTRLRQKEYAMLRSVGMTKHEFNRMTVLECMFYTVKSLIIGILIGLFCTIVIHFCFLYTWDERNNGILVFIFPWMAVAISVLVVTALIIFISVLSVRHIHKQNIVETIRNDNI